jgi:hypothetical protein
MCQLDDVLVYSLQSIGLWGESDFHKYGFFLCHGLFNKESIGLWGESEYLWS